MLRHPRHTEVDQVGGIDQFAARPADDSGRGSARGKVIAQDHREVVVVGIVDDAVAVVETLDDAQLRLRLRS